MFASKHSYTQPLSQKLKENRIPVNNTNSQILKFIECYVNQAANL